MTIVNNQLQCEEIQRMEFCRDHFLHLIIKVCSLLFIHQVERPFR